MMECYPSSLVLRHQCSWFLGLWTLTWIYTIGPPPSMSSAFELAPEIKPLAPVILGSLDSN